jgi:hypothetical protein
VKVKFYRTIANDKERHHTIEKLSHMMCESKKDKEVTEIRIQDSKVLNPRLLSFLCCLMIYRYSTKIGDSG